MENFLILISYPRPDFIPLVEINNMKVPSGLIHSVSTAWKTDDPMHVEITLGLRKGDQSPHYLTFTAMTIDRDALYSHVLDAGYLNPETSEFLLELVENHG